MYNLGMESEYRARLFKANGGSADAIVRLGEEMCQCGSEGRKFWARVSVIKREHNPFRRLIFRTMPYSVLEQRLISNRMVVKGIYHRWDAVEASGHQIMLKYGYLKKHGLPVPVSVRFDRARNRLVISDETEEGEWLLFDNKSGHEMPPEVRKVVNMEQLRAETIKLAITAFGGGCGVDLDDDAYVLKIRRDLRTYKLGILDIGINSYFLGEGGHRRTEKHVITRANFFIESL